MIGVALALALVGTTVAYAPPHRGLQRVSVRANVAPSVTMLAAKGKKKKKAPSKKRAGSGPAGSNTGFAQPSEASPSALADGEAQPGVPGGALPPMDGEDAVDMASVSPAASVDIASVRENGAQTAQRVPQAGSSVHLLTADLSQYRLAREARNEDILQVRARHARGVARAPRPARALTAPRRADPCDPLRRRSAARSRRTAWTPSCEPTGTCSSSASRCG